MNDLKLETILLSADYVPSSVKEVLEKAFVVRSLITMVCLRWDMAGLWIVAA